jgi:CubicO group peptidase (beta-lactamase class C family)
MAHLDPGQWQDRLDTLAREHAVPGAAFGVLRLGRGDAGDERVELATGVLNLGTGVPATPDALFQVGSITKVWTTTLLMTLVDEGRVDLDVPVRELLPEFRVADRAASAAITTRHLLTHTSGFDGDVFVDTGRGDDAVQRYVDRLGGTRQLFPPGAAWSYNNAGFTVAGRLVEHLLGTSWDQALRERVVEPLGLDATVTLPEEVLLHRAALGHVEHDDGWRPAPVWGLPRSCGPAGLVCSTAGDQLSFAAAHLRGGAVLSDTSRAAMTAPQAQRVDHAGAEDASAWGLGWALGAWGATAVLGHDGGTIGQSAFLRLFPDIGLATVLLSNGGAPDLLHHRLLTELLGEVAGVRVPGPLEPGTGRAPYPDELIGTWEQASARLEVRRDGDGLVLRHTDTTPFAGIDPDAVWERPLVPYAGGVALVQRPRSTSWAALTHERTPEELELLHLGWRAHTRV